MYRKIILLSILVLFISTQAFAGWYDSDWLYRKKVTCSDPVAGYVMADSIITLYVDDAAQTDAGEVDLEGLAQSDFDDIIITESDGTTLSQWEYQNEVASTSVEVITHGNGDKYVYFGNAGYTPNNANMQYSVAAGVHGMIPGGSYDSTNSRIYVGWTDAGYAPWLTWYSTSTGTWATSAFQISTPGLSDLHTAPTIHTLNGRVLACWGAHNSTLYYMRSTGDPNVLDYYTGAEEDFTTYTEVDPSSAITVTASKVTATGATRNDTAYVYKDKGAGYYDADFGFSFKFKSSTTDAGGLVCPFMLSNTVEDFYAAAAADHDLINVYVYGQTTLRLNETNGSTDTYDTGSITAGQEYFCQLFRDENVGTYGTLYLYVYNADTMAYVDTLVVTQTEKQDFRYLYGFCSYDDNQVNPATIYTSNLRELAWHPRTTISDYGTYPQFLSWNNSGTDTTILMYREGNGPPQDWHMRTSTNQGATMSAAAAYIVDDATYNMPYQTDCTIDASGNIYIIYEYADSSPSVYDNCYVAKYDEATDNRWENMAGTALAYPITKATSDTNCVVLDDNDSPYFHWGHIVLDSANNPAITYIDYDGATYDMYFRRWNGSAWESAVEVISNMNGYILHELVYVSGSGATAVYKILTGTTSTALTWAGREYTSTDGGGTWDYAAFTDLDVYCTTPVVGGTSATSYVIYTEAPSTHFPYTVRVYPEPADTFYYHTAGFLYTYKDEFDRDLPGITYPPSSHLAQLYSQVNTVAEDAALSSERLYFAAGADTTYKKVWTIHDFDTTGWTGYHIHIELPLYDSYNAYTKATFGTCDGDDWDTTSTNFPNDGIWLCVDTSGTKCDVSVQVGGTEKINDDDNDIAASDFDIYVKKDAGGDVVTIKNNGGATTVYTGTIPDSAQLDDTVNIEMGRYSSGGTSAAVYYDNVRFSEWDSTEPTWGTSGGLEEPTSGAQVIMIQ